MDFAGPDDTIYEEPAVLADKIITEDPALEAAMVVII